MVSENYISDPYINDIGMQTKRVVSSLFEEFVNVS